MVELLNHPEMGVSCEGEIFNPAVKGSIGFKWRSSHKEQMKFEEVVEGLKGFFAEGGGGKVRWKGYKQMMSDMASPTGQLVPDLMDAIPSLRVIFLLRDPFEGGMSDLEARALRSWMILNETSPSDFRSEYDHENVALSTEQTERYLRRMVRVSPRYLLSLLLHRCKLVEKCESQAEWLRVHWPATSLLLYTKDVVNENEREGVVRRAWGFLMRKEEGSKEMEEVAAKLRRYIVQPKNTHGRSKLPLESRIYDWPMVVTEMMKALDHSPGRNETCSVRIYDSLKRSLAKIDPKMIRLGRDVVDYPLSLVRKENVNRPSRLQLREMQGKRFGKLF